MQEVMMASNGLAGRSNQDFHMRMHKKCVPNGYRPAMTYVIDKIPFFNGSSTSAPSTTATSLLDVLN